MEYTMTRRVDGEFDEVVERVVEALEEEGFGVLTDVDVRRTFAEKLGLEGYPRYRILGACNPELAERGIRADPKLGALLPCNVVVYEPDDGEGVMVSAVDPEALLSVVDDPGLDPLGTDVHEAFERVLSRIAWSV